MTASSEALHPRSGARFLLEREGEGYRVSVYLPDGVSVFARLTFEDAGRAELSPALAPPWVHEEALKLARVLKRDPRPKLSRWRPAP